MLSTTTIGQSKAAGMILRALQLLLAIVVMGTDGYAIHSFHSYTVDTPFFGGYALLTTGVPSAWGFLMFCAAWTFVAAIEHFFLQNKLANRSLLSWTFVAVELIAVLSWLAGFIAIAVEAGTDTCPAGEKYCGSLIAATVAGGLEFLLFVITFAATSAAVMYGAKHTHSSHPTVPEVKESEGGHGTGV